MARPEIELPCRKQLAGTLLKDAVVTIHNNFITTSKDPRKVFTKKTINITSSPKTGDKTFEHMKEEIQELESHNKVTVICVVSDAAGEASKVRRLLREWKPSLMTLDCYSHQFNLSVGDYLNSKKTNHMYLEGLFWHMAFLNPECPLVQWRNLVRLVEVLYHRFFPEAKENTGIADQFIQYLNQEGPFDAATMQHMTRPGTPPGRLWNMVKREAPELCQRNQFTELPVKDLVYK
ncbi:hypothetical protein WJX77_002131 [Trebouxia sp. C0004]